ncbi:glycosyl transferase, group 1 family protein [Photobacterium leiognathi lrivu.4.1]|uniref:Glycosyl transferase, group 1 family protein n=1 Tax=Photobacterium leiognathi lrivu.4.1 TaxID=1248232 RepID=X0NLX7_PHOLE|nr:glycosyltransferase family 4 protein [Photobacterium leiognathi]GAD28982.1 glycosyl transferase, group 1 family protein [Photobacterium leiognathi lrivu.4.1]
MKILYFVNISSFFNSHFLTLALRAKEEGYDIHLLVGDEDKKEEYESLGINYHAIPLTRDGTKLFSEIKAIYYIRNKILDIKPDILHCFTIKPILYAGLSNLFSKSNRSLNVYSVTGLGSASLSESFKGKLFWFFLLSLYKLAFIQKNTVGVFENEDDKLTFIKDKVLLDKNSFLVNGAGIDTKKYVPNENKLNSTNKEVLLVARMLKDKGIREFIEAAEILYKRKSNCKMSLVGDIDPENISSLSLNEINEAVKEGYVVYLGYQSDILSLYQNADVACLPSYREGLPKSLIEAASCGLPIITTDVPGCRQMVDNGKNGILVEVKNSLALANSIEFLLNNTDLLIDMGNNSRKIAVEKFDYKHVLNSFMNIYRIAKK